MMVGKKLILMSLSALCSHEEKYCMNVDDFIVCTFLKARIHYTKSSRKDNIYTRFKRR